MRVTLCTTAPDVGGVTRHVFDLASELRARGDEVALASRSDTAAIRQAAEMMAIPWLSLTESVRAASDVWHLHLHNSLDTRALPLLSARRATARGAVVLTEHLPRTPRTDFTWPATVTPPGRERPGARQAKHLMKQGEYRSADAVIAVSRSSADFMACRWKTERERFIVIHNGVELLAQRDAAPTPSDGSPMRVVTIGALHLLKGYDVLIDAAALASEPWIVLLVGDGPERAALERQAGPLHREGRITFAGWQADGALAAQWADVLCAPSRYESFSYVILEAMAGGRAVVAAEVDGAGEAVIDGVTGRLVPPDSAADLAEALDRLARDPETRRRMGQAGRQRVADEFQLALMVDKTVELYMLLSRRRRRARRT
jgi:glycosyltransferase involved in cell wall biosynthesis